MDYIHFLSKLFFMRKWNLGFLFSHDDLFYIIIITIIKVSASIQKFLTRNSQK